MTITNRHTWLIAAAAATLLSGCTPNRPGGGQRMTVNPAPCNLLTDSAGHATADVTLHIPAKYFSSRSRLFIVPTLTAGDSAVKAYRPIVLDAPIYSKKMRRRKVLEDIYDPYADIAQTVSSTRHDFTTRCQTDISMPQPYDSLTLMAVASTDGCGRCTGIDTVEIARISRPVPPPRTLGLKWMTTEFVVRPKVRSGKGEARLQFVINRDDINLALGDNSRELTDMSNRLRPVLADSLATLQEMSIYGMASADGPLKFNTDLARRRALSARQYIAQTLGLTDDVTNRIRIGSRPEGWQPVLDAMTRDGCADSTAVKAILTKYASANDDVQERYIRRLKCWPVIRERYLQKDRKVEYAYSYTVKSFTTDSEMLAMYDKRPDAFSEDELLHVATLAKDDITREEVYRTTLRYYPQSAVARNNLAILLERSGRIDEAEEIMKK